MTAIALDRVVKTFGDYRALDGISLEIGAGEIFFLLGPSGCGKTTLLRTIAGFYEPDSGRVLFGDEDVTKTPPHRRQTAMMFQSYALWPHMTVGENVAFGLEEKKVGKAETEQRVKEALASVRMEGMEGRRIAQLSGGQQQRVALARALVVRPKALLLDEPLSNLDARLRLEMRSEIKRVCREFGLTAVYVTHDQKEALSIADRMAVLIGGRVSDVGRPEEVYRRPQTIETADFIGEANFLEGKMTGSDVVEVDGGIFRGEPGPRDWVPAMGQPVKVMVRPEGWTFAEGPGGPNVLRGELIETTYLGEVAQHEVQAGSVRIKVSELNPRQARRSGEVFLAAAVEDVVILPV